MKKQGKADDVANMDYGSINKDGKKGGSKNKIGSAGKNNSDQKQSEEDQDY